MADITHLGKDIAVTILSAVDYWFRLVGWMIVLGILRFAQTKANDTILFDAIVGFSFALMPVYFLAAATRYLEITGLAPRRKFIYAIVLFFIFVGALATIVVVNATVQVLSLVNGA